MDQRNPAAQKVLTDLTLAALSNQQLPTPTDPNAPPPPYDDDSDAGSDGDRDGRDPSPLSLTINAQNSIRGTGNVIPTTPSPLADATKFSTILIAAVNQLQNAGVPHANLRTRRVDLRLTINCGVTIVGDRNVIGHVAVKPKVPASTGQTPGASPASNAVNATAGAKRKAEHVSLYASRQSDREP